MIYYYTLLIIFAVVAYMIAVDANVAQYIILLWKLAGIQIRRGIFILTFKPRLMWDTWNIKRTIAGRKKDWADVAAEKLAHDLDIKRETD
jgi:hypothetical protein